MWDQKLATFLGLHERAFRDLGGVTTVVRHDNLKAAVVRACFYDPDSHDVYVAFAAHWGFTPLPTQPRRPQENGKQERSGGYVKSNALHGVGARTSTPDAFCGSGIGPIARSGITARRAAKSGRISWSRAAFVAAPRRDEFRSSPLPDNRSYIIPLVPGVALPRMSAEGFRSEEEIAQLPGARRIDALTVPGPSPDIYAFYRGTTQRNLYRIPLH